MRDENMKYKAVQQKFLTNIVSSVERDDVIFSHTKCYSRKVYVSPPSFRPIQTTQIQYCEV